MTVSLPERVEHACRELAASSTPITFPAVADLASIGRATLYRRPELRAVVEEHRQQTREALTLTGLAVQLDQLRAGLEAVAAKVRRQEEELRKLRRLRQN
jgi:hypothetical protein